MLSFAYFDSTSLTLSHFEALTVDNNFEGNVINITVQFNNNEHSDSKNLSRREYLYLALSF